MRQMMAPVLMCAIRSSSRYRNAYRPATLQYRIAPFFTSTLSRPHITYQRSAARFNEQVTQPARAPRCYHVTPEDDDIALVGSLSLR